MRFKNASIAGLNIFYREAGTPSAPKLVLLHGFPASSHQYRNLMPALEKRFHIIAPDYPGFAYSDMPDPNSFSYTFDRTSEIIEDFLTLLGFTKFGLYVQDYGGPVGFRILTRHPEWLEWLIIQNTNAYEVGFTPVWDKLRGAIGRRATKKPKKPSELSLSRAQYRRFTRMVIRIRKRLVLTTGIWTIIFSSGQTLNRCSSTFSMITELTLLSTRSGRRFYAIASQKRLSSEARTTSSSRVKAVRPT